MKMENSYLAFLVIILSSISACISQDDICDSLYDESGVLDVPRPPIQGSACWRIILPITKYVKIKVTKFSLTRGTCDYVNLQIKDTKTGRNYKFCPHETPPPITALGDVIITLLDKYQGGYSAFTLSYNTVDVLCNRPDSFRCTSISCIDKIQVCDGVQDCENGNDERDCADPNCNKRDAFHCTSNSCIDRSKVCDGVQDCQNGNDERNCADRNCNKEDAFHCTSNSCIDRSKVCDGFRDCENGNDERNCR